MTHEAVIDPLPTFALRTTICAALLCLGACGRNEPPAKAHVPADVYGTRSKGPAYPEPTEEEMRKAFVAMAEGANGVGGVEIEIPDKGKVKVLLKVESFTKIECKPAIGYYTCLSEVTTTTSEHPNPETIQRNDHYLRDAPGGWRLT